MSTFVDQEALLARSPSSSSSGTGSEDASKPTPELIQILYASETGNAQDAAERVGREVRQRGGRCRVESMEDFDLAELPHTPLLILLTSTHGRGQPPPAMLPLWDALLRSGLPDDILEDVSFAVFALGDSSYEKFCYAGKILARRMLSLGAHLIGSSRGSDRNIASDKLISEKLEGALAEDTMGMDQRDERNGNQDGRILDGHGQVPSGQENEIAHSTRNGNGKRDEKGLDISACLAWGDERAPDGMEEAFLPWLQKTMQAMLPLLSPPPPDIKISPWTALPDPIYYLDPVDKQSEAESAETTIVKDGEKDTLEPGWTWARLVKNDRVTPKGWEQDVREVELELEDEAMSSYLPGSICSLKPETSEEEITTFLRLNALEAEADRIVSLRSRLPEQPIPRQLPQHGTRTTLRRLLEHHLDVRCSPRKSFFEWLRRFSPDETEQERLEEFVTDPDELHTYATRPRRTILETIGDFRNMKIPLSHVLEALPPLRRRQFSIASNAADHPGKVQLLIALVNYKTNLQIRRRGLLSSWLQELPIGSRIPIKLDPPTLFLPASPDTPVILVGPGTGIAPMRAFLEQRVREGAAGNTALYFGCRSKDVDLYYEDEWESFRRQGVTVRVACSRDQGQKIYVQDRIKEDAAQVYDWIYRKKGNVYISGSSNAMPKAVRSAIAWGMSSESAAGSLSLEEAEQYVEDMFESGTRGGEESW